jgi:hypothetical protein
MRRLSASTFLFALVVGMLSIGLLPMPAVAQPPVEIVDLSASGSDLIATISWTTTTTSTTLPADALLSVTDPSDVVVAQVPVTPMPGIQTVVIPGALLPGSAEIFPLQRDLEVLTGPYQEILAEAGLAASASGKVAKKPARGNKKKYCYIKIYSLFCHDTSDDFGEDDLDLFGPDGQVIWSGSLNNGQTATMGTKILMIGGQVTLDLWEDRDDFLGTVLIDMSKANLGIQTAEYTGDDGHYTLRYEVRCFRKPLPPGYVW